MGLSTSRLRKNAGTSSFRGGLRPPGPDGPSRYDTRVFSTLLGLLHGNACEVLRPTLRGMESLDLGGHGARVEVMYDPHPRRLVDDQRVRLGQYPVAPRRVEGLLGLLQQIIKVRHRPVPPVLVGRRITAAVPVAKHRRRIGVAEADV